MSKNVRFTEVLKKAGAPKVYLPFSEPKKDRSFMRAVRETRVLSVKQEPTGTKKDFATVGYLAGQHTTYLIFPKSLTAFKTQRVVGINYDALGDAPIATPKPKSVSASRARSVSAVSAPKPRPELQPKEFKATVRLTATIEIPMTVHAMNRKEAGAKALQAARERADFSKAAIEAKLVKADGSP